jgi:hypothetical protein
MNEDFLKLVKDYLPEWIISASILIIIFLFLFKKVRYTFAGIKIPNIFGKQKITINDLKTHQFFIFIDYMEKYKINRMDFGCPGRTRVFREYFTYRCKTFNVNTKNLITEGIIEMHPNDIKNKIFETLYTSIKDTDKLMIEQCSNGEEVEIVKFVIEKFSDHADSCIQAFKEVIETIFESGFAYATNLDRLNAMLNVFLFAFVATFAESEKVLHMINGELSGKNYKGIKLQ